VCARSDGNMGTHGNPGDVPLISAVLIAAAVLTGVLLTHRLERDRTHEDRLWTERACEHWVPLHLCHRVLGLFRGFSMLGCSLLPVLPSGIWLRQSALSCCVLLSRLTTRSACMCKPIRCKTRTASATTIPIRTEANVLFARTDSERLHRR
jgi:hypothetical protein